MAVQTTQPKTTWLQALALSIAIGLAAGILAYIAARGIAGALLLGQQRELFEGVAGTLGSLDAPPPTDLRATRKAIQELEAQYHQICLLVGLGVGTLTALGSYLRIEQWGVDREISSAS
jgi:Na+-driven multidrug efflux pump